MPAMEKEDPKQVRAAQILVKLPYRKLRMWPEWIPRQSGEADTSASLGTVGAAKAMPSGEAASAGTLAARVPQRVSMQSGDAAEVPKQWPKAKRSGPRAEMSNKLEQGHVAAAANGKGSNVPLSNEQERCAEMTATSAQQRPVVAVEPMKTPSPNSPLDCGVGKSGDDAVRPQAKRKGIEARGSVVAGEGCSSPSKRVQVAEEEKPMSISVEPGVQSKTRASSDKGATLMFDLNLPCPSDEDDNGCADRT